ncbi:MAG: hypothetical protein KAT28_02850 [Candidatus Aenigmarchaeota archaeon]|nr:hypothetical protein [Candidatus Aenigmarchaeota archaeon]
MKDANEYLRRIHKNELNPKKILQELIFKEHVDKDLYQSFRQWSEDYRINELSKKKAYEGVGDYPDLPETAEEIQALIYKIESEPNLLASGHYISYCINKIPDEDIELEMKKAYSYLGENNNKNLTIKGDVADWVGRKNKGKILVKGNAENWVGAYMDGKELIIEGNTGYLSGAYMKKGELIIKKNCGDEPGHGLCGGSIIVEGNAGNRIGSFMQEGQIFVKGDAGDKVGDHLEGGDVVIKGDAGKVYENKNLIKKYLGGSFDFRGNAKYLGDCMIGGSIEIKDQLYFWK